VLPLSPTETDQPSQNFITINNTKFPDTVAETVTGVVNIETVLSAPAHHMFTLL
jgi:hypothetical protein